MSAPQGPFETPEEIRAAVGAAFAEMEALLIIHSFEARGYGHQDDDSVAGGGAS